LVENDHPALYRVLLAAMTGSDKSYLAYMAARLLEMRRVLKSTGSIYLHCDPTMSHYLKLVMDAVFGHASFLNEIIWHYQTGGAGKQRFSRKHDVILLYSKAKNYVFNFHDVKVSRSEKSLKRAQNQKGARISASDVSKMATDVWTDIQALNPMATERTGYPTQKPLMLLNRIIRASSNPGDVVLDPFCGCATTLVAADDVGRSWVGIDISPKAGDLVKRRIADRQGLWRNIVEREDIPKRTDLIIPRYKSHERRRMLYGRQEGNCAGCETHFIEARHLEVDHIISKGKGGTDHISNLQLLCPSCNRIKGNRGMEYLTMKLQIR